MFPFRCRKPGLTVLLLLFIFFTIFTGLKSFAQAPDLKFTYITRDQGLSNSSVLSLLQDSKGFMWFGTADGLNRFDGYHISVYKHAAGKTSLSNNNITRLFEDRRHRLWVGTSFGLNLFDRDHNQFKRFMHRTGDPTSLNSNFILSIHEDTQGNIWLGTTAGLNKFNEADETFKQFADKASTQENGAASNINLIYGEENGCLLLGTAGAGLRQFNIATGRFTAASKKYTALAALDNVIISAVKKDLKGNLWIGTLGNGLFFYNPLQHALKNYQQQPQNLRSISSNVVEDVLCDRKGNIWLTTENGGVNLWQPGTDNFYRYEDQPSTPLAFAQKTATALYEDNQDNIWIGTLKGGVGLYTPNAGKFKNYAQGDWPGGLSYRDVRCFSEDTDGTIWIGTDGGGINIMDKKTNRFKQYRHSAANTSTISADAILNIVRDKQGTIWVGTWGGGLNRYNRATGTFTNYLRHAGNANNRSPANVWKIFEDSNGVMWIGSYREGISIFDRKTETFTRITTAPEGQTAFAGNSILAVAEDDKHRLWVSTLDSGLNCFSADRSSINHYFNNTFEVVDNSRCLFIDRKKRIWVGKTGLYLFMEKQKKFIKYQTGSLLDNEKTQSIIEDDHGNLWIGTNDGLFSFNPESGKVKRYASADGLQGLEFSINACLKTRSGNLLFGGHQGFNVFNPDSISIRNYHYPVYITDLSVFNKSVDGANSGSPITKAISEADHITLSYDQSVFSLEYAALNFVAPSKTQYAYRLKGFDPNWNYVGPQRRATYTNLDPGDYTFCVKANAPDGSWNTQVKSIQITVKPPFWLTWWFKLLAAIAITFTIFLVLYYRRKAELRVFNEKKRDEIQQMQLQFFTNISHEFRTPLTLILGTLEQILKKDAGSLFTRQYHTINRNANRLMHLISELMDFRKSEAGSLKLKVMPGNFSHFICEIAREFEEQAQLHQISFTITQERDFDDTWFDRQVIEKILLNLLNNSFKYTADKGTISINVQSYLTENVQEYDGAIKMESNYKAKNYLYVSITDNGIGISKESIHRLFERYYRVSDHHLGSGIGLAFVKSLTLLHKGYIQVYSQYQKGTQIIVAIPCGQHDYGIEEIWPYNQKDNAAKLESIQYSPTYKLPDNPRPGVTRAASETQNKRCILIVDDNAELRDYFNEILGPFYKIIEADNGLTGIEKAREASPDLIISDVMMPAMDGIDFCAHIKDDFETSHIPFILLTAKDALESRLEGAESGADYYFSKPVSTDLLLLTIRNLFNQKQKIKDRYLKDYQVEVRDLVHSSKDKAFMDDLLKIIEAKLEDAELNVDFVCREIGVSKTKLYKKIKDITGQSINEFIRTVRLKKAVEIMTREDVLITEVMYRVGILSQSYFTTIFKKEFGTTPSQFQQQLDQKKTTDPKK